VVGGGVVAVGVRGGWEGGGDEGRVEWGSGGGV